MPRKIRELITELKSSGFVLKEGGKGSHIKFFHPNFPGAVTLSGRDGSDAKHYQERQVKVAIERVKNEYF